MRTLAISMRKTYLIDDKSLDGSFGNRRLQIKLNGEPGSLYPLKRAIWSLGNLLLYARIYKTFIDSTGRVFNYQRQTSVPLIYREIKKFIPFKNGTMLLIEGIHCPMWLYRPLQSHEQYAALLVVEKGYLLLGVTDKPNDKRTRFKI